MKCKYYNRRTQQITFIGGKTTIEENLCMLKMQSLEQKLQIYDALFRKHLQGSFVGDDCPVAATGKWNECPFFEPVE